MLFWSTPYSLDSLEIFGDARGSNLTDSILIAFKDNYVHLNDILQAEIEASNTNSVGNSTVIPVDTNLTTKNIATIVATNVTNGDDETYSATLP